MHIPFIDLKAQHHDVAEEVRTAMQRVVDAVAFSGGAEVERFEEEFARYCGARYCVGVNTGTSALHVALVAAGVGPGDEVITTPMTFVATIAAIEYCGATPVLVDCDPHTLIINPDQIAARLSSRTKAVIPVHLHGYLSDMAPICQMADKAGVTVIEDASQAHGAVRNGLRAGASGGLGCFSFYPSKNLGAYGEAGAVITNDADVARRMRMLRSWGAEQRDVHEFKGFNYRLAGLQAAVLRVKLKYLDQWNAARRALAARYDAHLAGLYLTRPPSADNGGNVYYVYAIRTARRDALRAWLETRGIGTHIHYPVPVHLQPAYRRPEYPQGCFPVCERAATELLSLPLYPEMPVEQVDQVCAAVRAFYESGT